MASEINSERANQAQELRELQDTYRKRKQAVDEEGKTDVQKIRKENSEKVRVESTSGDAAVNHVRNANKEKLEQLKSDADQKLIYERKTMGKRIQTEREHDKEQLDGLDENLKGRETQLRANIREESKRESVLRTRESEATNVLAQEEGAKRTQLMNQEQAALGDFEKRTAHEKETINQRANKDISELTEKYHQEMHQMQDQNKEAFTKQIQVSESQLKTQRDHEQTALENDRNAFGKRETGLRDHAQQELKQEQENDTQKLTSVKKENQHQLERQRDSDVRSMEKTRAYYDKNIAIVEKKGDEQIHEQREIQAYKIRNLDEQQKIDTQKAMAEHEQVLKDNEQNFKKQADQGKTFYRQALNEQRLRFDDAYQKNVEGYKEQVRGQREMLAQTLAKEKKDVIEDLGRYNSKNSDPFYRLAEPKAELSESGTHYIVTTKVPEHEKDNVKVIVHEDKVIVQGERRFADSVDDPESKIATHTYQTYRQEIPLEHPVREKHLQKSYDNGVLTIRIPKA